MNENITINLINKLFLILRTNHPNSGYLFKGDSSSDMEDVWKSQLLQVMKNGKVLDVKKVMEKTMIFRSKWDTNFPTYIEYYLFLLCDELPSINWLNCVVAQIKSNEFYNRDSPVQVGHRNDSAPNHHWDFAEAVAKNIDLNFAQFTPEYSNKCMMDAMATMIRLNNFIKPDNKELNLSYNDVKKLSAMSPDVRKESLNVLKSIVGIRNSDTMP